MRLTRRALLLIAVAGLPLCAQAPVRILTYNIRYGTANDGDEKWANRSAHVISTIRDHAPHLLGMQEALHFQLEEIQRALPGYRLLGVGRDDGKQAGEYAALLVDTTRFEVLDDGYFWYSDTPTVAGSKSWGNNVTRICTWARLLDRATTDTLRVYNSHWDHESQPSREKSADLLLKNIGTGPQSDRVIVMADFNSGETNPAFQKLLADSRFYLKDTYRAVHPDEKIVGTYHAFKGDSAGDKIDAILTSTSWTVVDATIDRRQFSDDLWASDHFAVSAVVRANGVVATLPEFAPIQREVFAVGGSMVKAYGDFDTDGDIDLFVGFKGQNSIVYQKTDTGFVVATGRELGGTRSALAAAWANFNRDPRITDHLPDLAVAFPPERGKSVIRLYQNKGMTHNGKFWDGLSDLTERAGISTASGTVRQLTWVDVDGDDRLDLYAAFADRSSAIFLNRPNTGIDLLDVNKMAEKFVPANEKQELTRLAKVGGGVWFDFDQDGDLDLFETGLDGQPNILYRNMGRGFDEVSRGSPLTWAGRKPDNISYSGNRPCVADVNNDGLLDVFIANRGRNALLLNTGDALFQDVSVAWGVATEGSFESCAFGDFDNDGRIDLFVSGRPAYEQAPRAYLLRNLGTRFVDATPKNIAELQVVNGAVWADVDGDGDLDLAVSSAGPDGTHSMLQNLLPAVDAAHSLDVSVRDLDNMFTLTGAEVRVYDAGDTRRLLGTRVVAAESGSGSQSDIPVHFGLPGVETVDVEVSYAVNGVRVIVRVQRVALARYRTHPLLVKVTTKTRDR